MTMSDGANASVDPSEIAKFAAIADRWWDENGPAKPLHLMNPCRLGYIKSQIAAEFGRDETARYALDRLAILDIGCGGGLVCEPLARMGASVSGIDAASENIDVAQQHANDVGLDIDYRAITAEALAETGATFDAVLALEIVEHVADPQAFVATIARLTRPGGVAIMSTLNRTAASYAVAILGAEYILQLLPKGTHDWARFPKPEELEGWMQAAGLETLDRRGMRLDPLQAGFSLSRDLSVNYLITASQPKP
ncbi:MAG: bifunctional 2-polyprenyl-6-hydroxyphenol methylase/3-demethylubiquinol 3-O-methyltransferase UbiG [Pseudomonadota bacterium]